jgi:iron complex transport system substrate-binding protein
LNTVLSRSVRRRAPLAIALSALSLVAACGSASTPATHTPDAGGTFPVTVHAGNGTVTVKTRPTSIVSLSPTATEMLFAIGAGKQVKAVDKDSDYPPGVPKTALDGVNVNIEAIANSRPDVVVASQLTDAQISALKALGITVVTEPAAASLTQVYGQLQQLGQVSGHEQSAVSLVSSMKARVAQIVKATGTRKASYYYELDQTYYSETSSTFIGQVLGLLGLHSIADAARGAAASGGYPQLTAEYILKANPTYILLADTLCCHQSAATVAARPGWSTLSAVKGGRVIALNDDIASRWGPRIVDLLATVAAALQQHPAPTGS